MPFDGAEDCQMRLRKNGAFDFACKGGAEWAGDGSYTASADKIVIELDRAARRGELLEVPPAPIRLSLEGGGNRLALTDENGARLSWVRSM